MSGKRKNDPSGKSAGQRLAQVDVTKRLKTKDYERRLGEVQQKLREVQLAYMRDERRAVIIFEGWDASGKGGVIRRMAFALDPRGCKFWPIAAPQPEDQGTHYFYRFWTKLPPPGRLAVFDRSWYGRVLVERVEGFAKPEEWRRAFDEINAFEQMLIDDGARVIKLFLHITLDEQLDRFADRIRDPLKRWKITSEDIRNHNKRPAYVEASEEMFERTDTDAAPWHLIPANDKKYARIAALQTVTDRLAEGIDLSPAQLAPDVERAARDVLGLEISHNVKVARPTDH